MADEDVLIGSLVEESWLTLEQAAQACSVAPDWLLGHLRQGRFPQAECAAGVWRFSAVTMVRARRMRAIERDFDADPELAALIADLLAELDALRARLGQV